ncbi:type IV toxin-antitoxin system YeeU family antitoxin [Serratia symbiotica]|uniref:type IV toxin-antitoxin system YeeU family antitoxin n=1 Tax=Serratia symbiotica TaxID=138074 RepID=UPI002090859A|nr:type IV toxin-antitoxin system YeeU family antitoxin [Serratia symbiotica]USS95763.1 type IV toxin-antitoxin system YeeU family antitoxin [Serratia symbiotica]
MPSITTPTWGLKRNVTPQLGARLVQEGSRLHFLADRADISGTFSETQIRDLDNAFPQFINHLELMLLSGELNPRHQHCVTLYRNGLTCEADSLGSHGYAYLAVYPTPQSTA